MKAYPCIWLIALLTLLSACGSSGGTDTDDTTYSMSFNVEEGVLTQIAKGAGVQKAIDPSNWSIECISLSETGTRTRSTGTYLAATQKIDVSGIPENQDTVCHLLQSNELLTTLQFADTNALASGRDTSKITANATARITYTEALGKALVTTDSGATGSLAEDRYNFGAEWTLSCKDVRNLLSNEVDTSKSCPSDIAGVTNYLHLIMSQDASGNLKTGYGAWSSHDAYVMCGRTEGLDDLPSGWTLDAVGSTNQGNAFTWSAPFATYSASSSSDEIFTMIRAANVSSLQTFDAYKADASHAEFCTNTDDICAMKYYEEVLRSHGRGNAVCWPDIRFTFDSNNTVTAARWPDLGSKTRPLSRYAIMESFKNGSESYMRSYDSFVTQVMNNNESVQCKVKTEFLVAVDTLSIVTPGADPGQNISALSKIVAPGTDPSGSIPRVGSVANMRFISNSLIEAVDGTDTSCAVCQSRLGQSNARTPNGFFSRVEMLSINPIPTP